MNRGDIWIADLGAPMGNESGKQGPVLIIQSNVFLTEGSQTLTVCLLTSEVKLASGPVRIHLPSGVANLDRPSSIMIDHIRTIDRLRLKRRIGILPEEWVTQVDDALKILLSLPG